MIDENNSTNDKLIDRIRKLYAMSREVEASPYEAEIALRRCESLMSKYGISESDLETSDFGVNKAFSFRKKIPLHIKSIGFATATLHDCILIRHDSELQFKGFSIDVEIAPLTMEFLLGTMERNLRSAKKEGTVKGGRSQAFDFRLGFAMEVLKRCKAISSERSPATSSGTGTSLSIRKLDMVKNNFNAHNGKTENIRYRNSKATQAGRVAGKNVSLNRQVSGTDSSESFPR